MTGARPCSIARKWRALTWSERGYLAEALGLLGIAAFLIAFGRFRFVIGTACWGGGDPPPPEERARIRRAVRWAVTVCARRVPWRAVCFQQGLAAQWMLRRRGIPSVLCYGGAPDERKGLAAHVWVLDGEYPVVGGEQASQFAMLAAFPQNSK